MLFSTTPGSFSVQKQLTEESEQFDKPGAVRILVQNFNAVTSRGEQLKREADERLRREPPVQDAMMPKRVFDASTLVRNRARNS